VLGHGLAGQYPVMQFPCPLQLVQIFGANMLEILLEHAESSSDWFSNGSLVT
jgi:hypothetical protein